MLVSLRATPGSKSLLPILYKQLKKGRVRYSCLRVHYYGLLLIRAITSGLIVTFPFYTLVNKLSLIRYITYCNNLLSLESEYIHCCLQSFPSSSCAKNGPLQARFSFGCSLSMRDAMNL